MLRFYRFSRLVVFCGVGILAAPPTAHAEPQIQLLLNDVAQLAQPITGTNGVITASGIKIGTFTVSLNGSSNSGSQGSKGVLRIAITSSRPITRALDTATGQTRKTSS
jgi:hypothetical protein